MSFNFYELHNHQKTSQYTRHTLYFTFSLKTAWYGIIRNYRPSEAASTIPQRGIWHSMVPTSHLLSNNSILYIEQNIPWKRTFNERQPLLKDELWSKMTFNISFFRFFDQKSLVSSFFHGLVIKSFLCALLFLDEV